MPEQPLYRDSLEKSLAGALNCESAENGSDTPDFILARFLRGCLDAFDQATRERKDWYKDQK